MDNLNSFKDIVVWVDLKSQFNNADANKNSTSWALGTRVLEVWPAQDKAINSSRTIVVWVEQKGTTESSRWTNLLLASWNTIQLNQLFIMNLFIFWDKSPISSSGHNYVNFQPKEKSLFFTSKWCFWRGMEECQSWAISELSAYYFSKIQYNGVYWETFT